VLKPQDWQQLKVDAMFQCFKWDIQSDDHCVLARYPLILEREQWDELCNLAEGLYVETISAECELLARPELHEDLSIPKPIRKQLRCIHQPPATAVRVMRFDFHLTTEGWRISEVNADVPGGYIEASGVTELMARHYPGCGIPCSIACEFVDSLCAALRPGALVAMVHATVYFDDHQVMRFLGKLMVERGLRVAMISPTQLEWQRDIARLCRSLGYHPVDGIVRFYPAEWMAELPDPRRWALFFRDSRTPISNPASAIFVQSKRFPLVWHKLQTEMKYWTRLLPETRAIERIKDIDDWVIKPVFGRVGEDIVIAGVTPEPRMKASCRSAKREPAQWIAQRRFFAIPIEDEVGEVYPTVGVFVMNGRVAGVYGRLARKPLIDNEAQDVAVLIASGGCA
jgi:glutathionylspermidine synthase